MSSPLSIYTAAPANGFLAANFPCRSKPCSMRRVNLDSQPANYLPVQIATLQRLERLEQLGREGRVISTDGDLWRRDSPSTGRSTDADSRTAASNSRK